MSDLTSTLMFWEKVPDTPAARKFMKGLVRVAPEQSRTAEKRVLVSP
jgi:hypothetical protein